MANFREQIQSPKPWETMGMFFGFFAVAKDAPSILRTLMVPSLLPKSIKKILLSSIPKSDFWLLLFFAICVTLLYAWLLWRTKVSEPVEQDKKEKAIAAIKRYQTVRIVRSLGVVFIREKILDLLNVGLYGTFRRQRNWPLEPTRCDYIDRITFNDSLGWEFQYSRNFKEVYFRTHPPSSDNYGPSECRLPTWKEIGLLLVASNFFPFWILLHLIRRPFIKT